MRFNDSALKHLAKTVEVPDKEGRLMYKAPKDIFKPRWFRLKGNLLFYHKVNEFGALGDKDPCGVLVLDQYKVKMESTNLFEFSVIFDGEYDRKYMFSGHTFEHSQEWANAIQQADYDHLRLHLRSLRQQLWQRLGHDPVDGFQQSVLNQLLSANIPSPTSPFDVPSTGNKKEKRNSLPRNSPGSSQFSNGAELETPKDSGKGKSTFYTAPSVAPLPPARQVHTQSSFTQKTGLGCDRLRQEAFRQNQDALPRGSSPIDKGLSSVSGKEVLKKPTHDPFCVESEPQHLASTRPLVVRRQHQPAGVPTTARSYTLIDSAVRTPTAMQPLAPTRVMSSSIHGNIPVTDNHKNSHDKSSRSRSQIDARRVQSDKTESRENAKDKFAGIDFLNCNAAPVITIPAPKQASTGLPKHCSVTPAGQGQIKNGNGSARGAATWSAQFEGIRLDPPPSATSTKNHNVQAAPKEATVQKRPSPLNWETFD